MMKKIVSAGMSKFGGLVLFAATFFVAVKVLGDVTPPTEPTCPTPQQVTAFQAAVYAAGAMNDASSEMNTADTGITGANADLNSTLTAYSAYIDACGQNATIEGYIVAAQTALNSAQTSYDNAVSEYSDADTFWDLAESKWNTGIDCNDNVALTDAADLWYENTGSAYNYGVQADNAALEAQCFVGTAETAIENANALIAAGCGCP